MNEDKKGIKEEIAKFLENPSRESFREIIRNNGGEFPNLDFKESFPAFPKLAKHLLAMANSEGGCIVIGIAEKEDKSLEIRGISEIIDKSDITKGIEKYLPSFLLDDITILDFAYEETEYPKLKGKTFQIVLIDSNSNHLPFIALSNGEGIRKHAIYVRKGTDSEEASYDALQKILNRRLETGYSSKNELDLLNHIEQLKILYNQINKNFVRYKKNAFGLESIAKTISSFMSQTIEEVKENPKYPKEDFEDFVVRMIEKKKEKIEIEIGVNDF